MTELTIEQQLSLHLFEDRVRQMNREDAQEALVNLYREMVTKEVHYKKLIGEQWGMRSPGEANEIT
ncbi:MAG: hypothetical protein NVS2B14_11390 [Chamaesiphon sp.]